MPKWPKICNENVGTQRKENKTKEKQNQKPRKKIEKKRAVTDDRACEIVGECVINMVTECCSTMLEGHHNKI